MTSESEDLGGIWKKLCFKGTCAGAFLRKEVSPVEVRKRVKKGVDKMEEERKEGEGWTEGSLKAQCVKENRSVPSPRQPTAQAH